MVYNDILSGLPVFRYSIFKVALILLIAWVFLKISESFINQLFF